MNQTKLESSDKITFIDRRCFAMNKMRFIGYDGGWQEKKSQTVSFPFPIFLPLADIARAVQQLDKNLLDSANTFILK
jgi:hypothetical protein